ncbi:cyclin-dependent kinase inhibitor 3 family protein [Desertifilum sp. FACHB-1129]|uniref:cyclin-dependent kinase inhibitor 3 family protein n=1 Tax=Desertifilum TaxID=1185872 RepID=UPI00090422E5|nr:MULTISPECIES: cyclin-dependent kinase inhibitor 3 family protein [Desertifilum]MBD2314251.1 cyclin-dependent kinase inhibitor 3 family protein [Desertifilum sp. FACHB-1129]MBD2324699.1 cyclin-dependent kinase inhibitor 3 family protein [Desertifilum sp. FACHB-866]MBD2334745.1 cyclin-dependent kinase inhibitor 3 family protein [Desertifilum sp. FACHB-868]MDA0211513.1 cyclin-dependent kinase inhibitor 3 family protein [Cyanobacteria bacterium FC1]
MTQTSLNLPKRDRRPLITSDTHPIQVDFLSDEVIPRSGRLGMTLAPGKQNKGMRAIWQRNLDQDLHRLKHDYGTQILVTLLEADDWEQLQIPNLLNCVQAREMQSVWFPIRDFGTPTSMLGLGHLVQTILSALNQGQTVVIHCKAGLGRTGLVTASCLVALGYSPLEAFAEIRKARPGSVETPEQEAYVVEFARFWTHRAI